MFKELRDFAVKGNVMDMAVGIIIGSAFSTVVKSLVDDIIMPPIGLLLGRVDFSNLFINLSGESYDSLAAAQEAGAATVNYGLFISNIITFLIVAFAVFLLVKAFNAAQDTAVVDQEEEAPADEEPTSKECPHCFTQIPYKASRCPNCTSELDAG